MIIPPSKELLIFYNQIYEWVDQVYPDQDKPSLSFKKDTSQSILDLFDSIESKIGFDSLERKYWNNNYGQINHEK